VSNSNSGQTKLGHVFGGLTKDNVLLWFKTRSEGAGEPPVINKEVVCDSTPQDFGLTRGGEKGG